MARHFWLEALITGLMQDGGWNKLEPGLRRFLLSECSMP